MEVGIGKVTNEIGGEKIDGVLVEVILNGKVIASKTGGSGTRLSIPISNKTYFVRYTKPGYYTKIIEMDLMHHRRNLMLHL